MASTEAIATPVPFGYANPSEWMRPAEGVPCKIRWGYRLHSGPYAGGVGIHADIPLRYWPEGEPDPTFRSSESYWENGRLVPGKPWSDWVPVENYYQPSWMREMLPGLDRWKQWRAYETALKGWLEEHFEALGLWHQNESGDDHLPESKGLEWVLVLLPDKPVMLEALGFTKPPLGDA